MTIEEIDVPDVSRDPALIKALGQNGNGLTQVSAELVRASRFRPVYRYHVGNGDDRSRRVFIGKADHRNGVGDTFEYMTRLWAAGLRGDDGFAIPEPVAHLAELALLLQTEAPGRCLYEWLPTPEAGVGQARDCGRFLGRLHQLDLGDAHRLPVDYETAKLGTYRDGLAGAAPAQTGRLAVLTEATLSALAATVTGPVVPTHGDYQPKNIYVDGTAVTVIDWDRGALAHPGRDLGHFLGQCLTMGWVKAGSFEAMRPWNDAFLEGYAELGPPNHGSTAWEPAIGPYVARTILEVLYYKLVVKPVRNPDFLDRWLSELERALG